MKNLLLGVLLCAFIAGCAAEPVAKSETSQHDAFFNRCVAAEQESLDKDRIAKGNISEIDRNPEKICEVIALICKLEPADEGCRTYDDKPKAGSGAFDSSTDGIWSGELVDAKAPKEKFDVRLRLDNVEVNVYYKTPAGQWVDVMPGLFVISRSGSNATIHATNSGGDDDGRWFETWTFVVTKKSTDVMQVEWVRMVNNTDLPDTSPKKIFSQTASGTLSRDH